MIIVGVVVIIVVRNMKRSILLIFVILSNGVLKYPMYGKFPINIEQTAYFVE